MLGAGTGITPLYQVAHLMFSLLFIFLEYSDSFGVGKG